MEWVFGITDAVVEPSDWTTDPPNWEDETLTAQEQSSFRAFMTEVCNTAVKNRREYDHEVNDHLWKLEIRSYERTVDPRRNAADMVLDSIHARNDDDSVSSDTSDDDTSRRGPFCIAPSFNVAQEQENAGYSMERFRVLPCSTKLTQQLVPQGSVMELTYDYGTTTRLFLKALQVRPAGSGSTSPRGVADGATQMKDEQDLQSVPAFALAKDAQMDAFYPNFAKSFLGGYVPVVSGDNKGMAPSTAVGSSILGYSSCFASRIDTTFAAMEDATCSTDLMFAPAPFQDLNEFFKVAEESWVPKDPSENKDLSEYRYNGVSRWVLPKGEQGDAHYKRFQDTLAGHSFQKYLLYRQEDGDDASGKTHFDFVKAFPKTAAQLTTGKFRWISYKKGILRVLVGRGRGAHSRGFSSEQTLRTWKRPFSSLHELFCAVETSWTYEGKELDSDTYLEAFDANVGPVTPPKRRKQSP